MEIVRGTKSFSLDNQRFQNVLAGYSRVVIDLGTGDGRFVRYNAARHPREYFVGIDACRENMRVNSRKAPVNALFVVANALDLPRELFGIADQVVVNFPWASLLKGLLSADPGLLAGVAGITRPGTVLEVRLNGGALAEAGWPLDEGAARMGRVLKASGFAMAPPAPISAADLRTWPTTWAKRIAFGRDPRCRVLMGKRL